MPRSFGCSRAPPQPAGVTLVGSAAARPGAGGGGAHHVHTAASCSSLLQVFISLFGSTLHNCRFLPPEAVVLEIHGALKNDVGPPDWYLYYNLCQRVMGLRWVGFAASNAMGNHFDDEVSSLPALSARLSTPTSSSSCALGACANNHGGKAASCAPSWWSY